MGNKVNAEMEGFHKMIINKVERELEGKEKEWEKKFERVEGMIREIEKKYRGEV